MSVNINAIIASQLSEGYALLEKANKLSKEELVTVELLRDHLENHPEHFRVLNFKYMSQDYNEEDPHNRYGIKFDLALLDPQERVLTIKALFLDQEFGLSNYGFQPKDGLKSVRHLYELGEPETFKDVEGEDYKVVESFELNSLVLAFKQGTEITEELVEKILTEDYDKFLKSNPAQVVSFYDVDKEALVIGGNLGVKGGGKKTPGLTLTKNNYAISGIEELFYVKGPLGSSKVAVVYLPEEVKEEVPVQINNVVGTNRFLYFGNVQFTKADAPVGV